MASTNQSPFYQRAEEDFLKAATDEERIACLEIMIKECPKHKSSENMLRNLTTRLKKLRDGVEKRKKAGKGGKQGIRKADIQCVICGPPNTGKSTIFNILTNHNPEAKISENPFTTYEPLLGTFKFENTPIQIIDDAPIPNHDKSTVNSTDTLLIIIDNLNQIEQVDKEIWKSKAKKVYLFNKIDNLSENEIRKIEAKIKSEHKNLDYFFFHKKPTIAEINELKKKIFSTFSILRIYTKEPGKEPSKDPMILKPGSTVRDASENILKGMSKKIKQTRIWGPSSKFGGQAVGIDHTLKDKDVVEFKTK